MIQNQARRLRATFLASDVAATCAALLAAYVVRFETVWPTPLGVQPFGNYLRLLPVLALLWPVVFYFHRLYPLRRERSFVDEALAVLIASSLATLLLVGLLSFSRAFSLPRTLLVLFLGLDVLFVSLGRFGIWRYLEKVWSAGVGVRRALVVGAGEAGRAVADKLLDHPAAGI